MGFESFAKNAAFGFMDSAALGLLPDEWGPSQFDSSGEWGRVAGDLLGLAIPYGFLKIPGKALGYVDKIRKSGAMGGRVFTGTGRALEKAGLKKFGGRIAQWDNNIKEKIIQNLGTAEKPGISHYLLKEAYEGAVVGGLYGAGTEIGNSWFGNQANSSWDMIFNPIGGALSGAALGGLAGAAFGGAIGGYKGYRNKGITNRLGSLEDPVERLNPAPIKGLLPDARLMLPPHQSALPPYPFHR